MTKLRTVKTTQYERKKYIEELRPEDVGKVLKMKLHMTKFLANYTSKGENRKCRLCNKDDETNEHILDCHRVKRILKHLKIDSTYLESENIVKCMKAAKVLEAVEKILEQRKY